MSMFTKIGERPVPGDGWLARLEFPGVWTSKGMDAPRDGRKMPRIMTDGKLKSWKRPSGFGDPLEDKENLQKWQMRNVALGLSRDPELLVKFRTFEDVHGADARDVDALLKEAQLLAGSEDRANYGTELHELTERDDLSLTIGPLDPVRARDLEAYRRARNAIGAQILAVELFGVSDLYGAAGTSDRIAMIDDPDLEENEVVVLDVKTSGRFKTGEEKMSDLLKYSRGKFACQLKVYATMEQYNANTGERRPLIPGRVISQRFAYIIHVPAGTGRYRVERIDLTRGEYGVTLAQQVGEWRNSWNRVAAVGKTLAEGMVEDE